MWISQHSCEYDECHSTVVTNAYFTTVVKNASRDTCDNHVFHNICDNYGSHNTLGTTMYLTTLLLMDSLSCCNAFMGAISHFVHTSQLHTLQVISEMGICKNREGEVFYLMLMSFHKILQHQWKMNTVQTSCAKTLALKNQNTCK